MASQEKQHGETWSRPPPAAATPTSATTATLPLCTNNCGFFGSPQTICYRETLLNADTIGASARGFLLPPRDHPMHAAVKPHDFTPVDVQESMPAKLHAQHCHTCRKRVGLGCRFKCRCGGDRYVFCSSHRFPDQHSCTFDYRSAGREAISKDNPVVKADKLRDRI